VLAPALAVDTRRPSLPVMRSFVHFAGLLFALVASAHATLLNSTTLVNLRVEGVNSTIYEGPVLARPQNVTTAAGGTHPCTGLNAGANAAPGATCTSALAAAAKTAGFTFDGCVSLLLRCRPVR
jgi:hypothetical protein